MKPNHKILYHCGENSSHRLLLVRCSRASDSWRAYVYAEETGALVYQSRSEADVFHAEHLAQLAALRNGVSPILHSEQQFAA